MNEGESGQTLVEYALILSAFSIAMMAALVLFQTALSGLYARIIAATEALV